MTSPTFSPRLFRAHCVMPLDYFDRAPRPRLDPPPVIPRGMTEGQKAAMSLAGIVAASILAGFVESLTP